MAHRSGRVIDTDMLISLVLQVSSDDQEREGSEDNNPNVNAHQSRPAATLPVINLASRHYTRNISAESAVSLYRSKFIDCLAGPVSNSYPNVDLL
jgi:hypothetical protein